MRHWLPHLRGRSRLLRYLHCMHASTSTPSTLLHSGCCMSLSAHAAPSSIGLPSFAFVAHHQPPHYISSPHAQCILVLLTVLLVGCHCADINACTNNPCDANAACADSDAPALDNADGRTCTCNDGYSGDGEDGDCAGEC